MWSSCSRSVIQSLDLACLKVRWKLSSKETQKVIHQNIDLKDHPADQSGDQDHDVYRNVPGQNSEWDGNKQCQMMMKTEYAR